MTVYSFGNEYFVLNKYLFIKLHWYYVVRENLYHSHHDGSLKSTILKFTISM